MLDGRRWRGKCYTCKWACIANVIIEYDRGVSREIKVRELTAMARKAASGMSSGAPVSVPYKEVREIYYDDGELDIICTERIVEMMIKKRDVYVV